MICLIRLRRLCGNAGKASRPHSKNKVQKSNVSMSATLKDGVVHVNAGFTFCFHSKLGKQLELTGFGWRGLHADVNRWFNKIEYVNI